MSRIPMSEQQPASTTDNAQATSEGGRGRRPGKPERSSRDQSKMLAVGREKIAERRWKEAVNALKRVLVVDRNNGPAMANLAIAYQQQRKFNDAGKLMKRALEAAPMEPEVHMLNGRLLHGYGEMDKSANAHSYALHLNPQRSDEPRVGKDEVSKWRSRWSPNH